MKSSEISENHKTAVAYIRVSTDRQKHFGYSLPEQASRVSNYRQRNSMYIKKTFIEHYSAVTIKRPQFDKLNKYVRKNKNEIDLLIVLRYDRFARNEADSLIAEEKFKNWGIKLVAIDQPVDDSKPTGRLVKSMYRALAQVDNEEKAIAKKRGMRRAQREGRYFGGLPFGFYKGKDVNGKRLLIENSKEAQLMVEIFQRAANREKLEHIRKSLILRGLTIQKSRFPEMLKNVIYIGKIRIKAWEEEEEPEEIVDGKHMAIIVKKSRCIEK